jgi:hypothetical protein
MRRWESKGKEGRKEGRNSEKGSNDMKKVEG